MSTEEPIILYHYCSNETFLSIMQNKSIRLSHIALSNDHQEGNWILHSLIEQCKNKGIGPEKIQILNYYLYERDPSPDHFAFCLSEKGDLLSQWRGYADNSSGISIGFQREALKKLEFENNANLFQVKYYEYKNSTQNNKEIDNQIDEVLSYIDEGALDYNKTEEVPANKINRFGYIRSELMHVCNSLNQQRFFKKTWLLKKKKNGGLSKHTI